MMHAIPLFISSTEIFFILFLLIIVFGADKIPAIAKGTVNGMRTLQTATHDIKSDIQRRAATQVIDAALATCIQEEINKVMGEIEDLTCSVRRKL